jgi:hypothetical protein
MTIRVARITRAEARVWREGIFSLSFCAAMYFDLIHGFDRVVASVAFDLKYIHDSKIYKNRIHTFLIVILGAEQRTGQGAGSCVCRVSTPAGVEARRSTTIRLTALTPGLQ